ncbi:hypothetical protein JCM1840_006093 [Sporobolomyces johnsonii]
MRFALAIALLVVVAVFSSPAEASKKKKNKIVPSLCPVGELACPILGSTTYTDAVKHHFATKGEVSGVMAGAGGYECINAKEALDSCGGCASTGEGQDCTKLRGAAGVGCEDGVCRVFSCQSGWKPALSGSKCIRAKSLDERSPKNGTRPAARRHLNHRHARHSSHSGPITP